MRDVVTTIIHEKYNRSDAFNDVALLKLSADLPFSASISAIEMLEEELPSDVNVVISGWGRTGGNEKVSTRLKFNTLKTLAEADCIYATKIIHKGLICLSHPANNGACYVWSRFVVDVFESNRILLLL